MKVYLLRALPLEFFALLDSAELRLVLGKNPTMKIKHALRRKDTFLDGWQKTKRKAKALSEFHCFDPVWGSQEPECWLCGDLVKWWKSLLIEIGKAKCPVVASPELDVKATDLRLNCCAVQVSALQRLSELLL